MWAVLEKRNALKILNKAPREVVVRYEAWKRIVELQGPHGLRYVRGFHDESLRGEWDGYRSSRLGRQWRVIYWVEDKVLEVFVIEITPHDYRRK